MSTVPGSSSDKPIKIEQEPDFLVKQLYQIYDVTPISDGDVLALKGIKFVVACNICNFRISSEAEPRLQDWVPFQEHARMHILEQERTLDIKKTFLSASPHKARKENLKTICEPEPGLVDKLEDNKDDHSTNTLFSDTPESKQLGGDGGLREGYVMVCFFCGCENCGSGVNHPVRMRCYICHEHGKHWSMNCPTGRYHGPPMPERYACSYWDDV